VVIVQSLYPLLYVICKSLFKMNIDYIDPNTKKEERPYYSHFDTFSATYVALAMYVVLVSVSMKKDLSIFIKLSSLGVICVISLILFVVGFGFYSIATSKYEFEFTDSGTSDPPADTSTILLFNSQFSNLAGVLCAGYFIHQVSIPIIQNAAEPEKNLRNVFLGYLLVFLCYIIVGGLGYFAFTGNTFSSKRKEDG